MELCRYILLVASTCFILIVALTIPAVNAVKNVNQVTMVTVLLATAGDAIVTHVVLQVVYVMTSLENALVSQGSQVNDVQLVRFVVQLFKTFVLLFFSHICTYPI